LTEVALRPATAGDDELLRAVYASTRAGELAVTPWTDEQKAAFCAMQFEAQRGHYAEAYPELVQDVVVVDGEDAGRLLVARLPGDIRVVDIAILPAFRGLGVGGRLLADVLDEAEAAGSKVTIHVEHQNRARHLYDRLGFEVVEDIGIYLRMEWTPSRAT
jgi:ribosomal protein S18 acetylase RimI-like enzyme